MTAVLRGSFVPLVTPFDEDLKVDYGTYALLVDRQAAGGSHGVVVTNFAYGNTRDRQRIAHGGRHLGVFYGNPDFAALPGCSARTVSGVEKSGDLAGELVQFALSGQQKLHKFRAATRRRRLPRWEAGRRDGGHCRWVSLQK